MIKHEQGQSEEREITLRTTRHRVFQAIPFALFLGSTACHRTTIGSGVVRCHYMMYACGDCVPWFRVDSVLAGPFADLVGKDIRIVDETTTDGSAIVDTIQRCIICYDFTASGNVHRRGDELIMVAGSVGLRLRQDCCVP